MLEIQRLRRVAQAALGEQFDIRAFHVEVLKDGAIPLQVLETKIQRRIKAQRMPAASRACHAPRPLAMLNPGPRRTARTRVRGDA